MNALIIYHTITGHTRRAAEDIAEGLAGEGVTARLLPAGEMPRWDLAGQAIVVVGSPCHAGSLAIRAGVSGAVLGVLNKLTDSALAGIVGGAFSVNSAYGGRRTVQAIERRLRAAGATVPQTGVVVKAGVPFSLFTGPKASEQHREELRHLGRTLAQTAKAGREAGPARE
jgi:flavorubredoxin